MASFFESNAHYYSCSGGTITAAYDADLREARTRKLYVSPTTVAGVRANPGLDIWKQSLLVDTVLANPQLFDEAIEDYKKRIKELVRKPAGDAATFGTDLHDALEHYPQMPMDPTLLPWFEEYGRWHEANVAESIANEMMVAHHGIGVAGKTDLVCRLKDGRTAIVDYKTQGIKPGKKPNFYDSWAWQLAFYGEAYRLGSGMAEPITCISLAIDSGKPVAPVAKEWTREEIDLARKAFVCHSWLWQADKDFWPVGRWEVSDFWKSN